MSCRDHETFLSFAIWHKAWQTGRLTARWAAADRLTWHLSVLLRRRQGFHRLTWPPVSPVGGAQKDRQTCSQTGDGHLVLFSQNPTVRRNMNHPVAHHRTRDLVSSPKVRVVAYGVEEPVQSRVNPWSLHSTYARTLAPVLAGVSPNCLSRGETMTPTQKRPECCRHPAPMPRSTRGTASFSILLDEALKSSHMCPPCPFPSSPVGGVAVASLLSPTHTALRKALSCVLHNQTMRPPSSPKDQEQGSSQTGRSSYHGPVSTYRTWHRRIHDKRTSRSIASPQTGRTDQPVPEGAAVISPWRGAFYFL